MNVPSVLLAFKVSQLSPTTLCFSVPQIQKQSTESCLGAHLATLTLHPRATTPSILLILALQPLSQSWQDPLHPALTSTGHVCPSDAKALAACVAFSSKHQCPYVPSDKQIQQEILCWEWGELCGEVVTLDIVFLAISS